MFIIIVSTYLLNELHLIKMRQKRLLNDLNLKSLKFKLITYVSMCEQNWLSKCFINYLFKEKSNMSLQFFNTS